VVLSRFTPTMEMDANHASFIPGEPACTPIPATAEAAGGMG
jgi:hypothetical protein